MNQSVMNSLIVVLLNRWLSDLLQAIKDVEALESNGKRSVVALTEWVTEDGTRPTSPLEISLATVALSLRPRTFEVPGGLIVLEPLQKMVSELEAILSDLRQDEEDE